MARKLILENIKKAKFTKSFTRLELGGALYSLNEKGFENYEIGEYTDDIFKKKVSTPFKNMTVVIMLNYNNKPLMPLFIFNERYRNPHKGVRFNMQIKSSFLDSAERLACLAIVAFDKNLIKTVQFLNKKFFSGEKRKLNPSIIDDAKKYLNDDPEKLANFTDPEKFNDRTFDFSNCGAIEISNLNILEVKKVAKRKIKVNDSTINRDKVKEALKKYSNDKNEEFKKGLISTCPNIYAEYFDNYYKEFLTISVTKKTNPIRLTLEIDKKIIFNTYDFSIIDDEVEVFYLYLRKFVKKCISFFNSLEKGNSVERILDTGKETFEININTDNVNIEDTDILKSYLGISKFDL